MENQGNGPVACTDVGVKILGLKLESKTGDTQLAGHEEDSDEVTQLRTRLADVEAAIEALSAGKSGASVDPSDVININSAEKHYKIFFELMNEGGLILDNSGRILQCNSCFAMMMRESIDRLRGSSFFVHLAPPSRQRVAATLEIGNAAAFEVGFLSKWGEEIPCLLSLTTIEESGEHINYVVVTDLRDQHAAVEALQKSERFNRAILNSMDSEIAVLDPGGKIIAVNDSWQRFAVENAARNSEPGYDSGIGVDYLSVCEEATRQSHPGASEALEGIKSVLAGDLPSFRLEYACPSPEEERWFNMNVTPLGSEHHGVVIAHSDITKRVQAEENIKKALEEKVILLRELYHRTRNNMAVIISMLDMQSINFKDIQLKGCFVVAENRIRSMALVHQKLYDSNDLSQINFGEYIGELIGLLIDSYQINYADIDTVFELDEVFLLIDSAIPCGLILNELISNTLRHAFSAGEKGTIKIVLRLGEDSEIDLRVSDNGRGVPAGFDFRRDGNLGLQTIFLLGESQLHGKVDFDTRNGLECRLRFKDNYYKRRV